MNRRTFKNGKVKIVIIHILVWLGYILYELITVFQIGGREMNLIETFFNFCLYAILFYTISYAILPRFYAKRKYLELVIVLIVVFGCFTFLRYHIKISLMPLFKDTLIYPFVSFRVFLSQTLWRGGYFTMISFGYWFASNLLKKEKEKSEDLKKIALMEQSIQEAEIRNLKNQINPHFLFNTLNFLYDKVNSYSESIGKAILLLSDLMRYSLKKTEAGSKAFLIDEVKHLQNYIEINQLRFDHRLQVNFEIKGNLEYRLVIPLLLITFVENCFKYGELFMKEHPVCIYLEVTDTTLIFVTKNKKKFQSTSLEKSTGIGNKNARKRLDLVYPQRYLLEVDEDDEFHKVNLKIKL